MNHMKQHKLLKKERVKNWKKVRRLNKKLRKKRRVKRNNKRKTKKKRKIGRRGIMKKMRRRKLNN